MAAWAKEEENTSEHRPAEEVREKGKRRTRLRLHLG